MCTKAASVTIHHRVGWAKKSWQRILECTDMQVLYFFKQNSETTRYHMPWHHLYYAVEDLDSRSYARGGVKPPSRTFPLLFPPLRSRNPFIATRSGAALKLPQRARAEPVRQTYLVHFRHNFASVWVPKWWRISCDLFSIWRPFTQYWCSCQMWPFSVTKMMNNKFTSS